MVEQELTYQIFFFFFPSQKHGNACLGILNGSEVGLGKFNIIGGKQKTKKQQWPLKI